jgi:hypothetical protein
MRHALILLLLVFASVPAGGRNLVRVPAVPEVRLAVDSAFRPLPRLAFPIEALTNAERHIFVEADSRGRLRRMVVVQFEKVQGGSDFRFVFPSTPPRRFGAQVYRAGTFAYDDEAAAAAEPLREAGRTRRFLAEHGLSAPRFWKVARLARVSDPKGLSETILFYMERADEGLAGRSSDSGDIALPPEESARLFAALEAAVRPARP